MAVGIELHRFFGSGLRRAKNVPGLRRAKNGSGLRRAKNVSPLHFP
jgi:hypothetical protein